MERNIFGVLTGLVLALLIIEETTCENNEIIHPNKTIEMSNGKYTSTPEYDAHFFLLMVPDSVHKKINRLNRLRQDEEGGGDESFAQTGEYLGQIIQGVLGGDLRPIFAGSVKLVDEPTAQQNLGGFLNAIAPGLNLVLREMYTRAQTALGFGVTPTPMNATVTPDSLTNGTAVKFVKTNITVYIDDETNATLVEEIQLPQSQQNSQRPLQQMKLPSPVPTTAWQWVLNRIQESTTTVMPLPLAGLRTPSSTGDDDDDEYSDNSFFQ